MHKVYLEWEVLIVNSVLAWCMEVELQELVCGALESHTPSDRVTENFHSCSQVLVLGFESGRIVGNVPSTRFGADAGIKVDGRLVFALRTSGIVWAKRVPVQWACKTSVGKLCSSCSVVQMSVMRTDGLGSSREERGNGKNSVGIHDGGQEIYQ